jgi:formylglycine-generating enzyme required for sulfatase activity
MGGGDPDIHIYRGGACDNDGVNCRSAIRYAAEQDLRSSAIGFRVVVESGGG